MNERITGIILSGGQSSRMGNDKALLEIGGKAIIELMIEKLQSFSDEIIISANDADAYSKFDYKVVRDKFQHSGPLAGIYSSILESNSEKNFIISCDLPLVTTEVIERLINVDSKKEIILPIVDGKYQQLCGVYSRAILEKAEMILRKGEMRRGRREEREKGRKRNTSVKYLLSVSDVEFVDVTDIANENEFLNMNTKEDFAIIEEILLKKK